MHGIVLWDALLLGAGEHGQDAHSQHLASHRRPPVAPQKVQADVPVGIDVHVFGTRLEKVDTGWFGGVVPGEAHLKREGLPLVHRALHSSHRHLPLTYTVTHR